jgi:hypothetical protein
MHMTPVQGTHLMMGGRFVKGLASSDKESFNYSCGIYRCIVYGAQKITEEGDEWQSG